MEYMLSDLHWVYNLENGHLSVFVKNSSGTRVKDIASGSVYDIPLYNNGYGHSERRLDFNKILNTSGHIKYSFQQLYGIVGVNAFRTLKNEQKQVDRDMKKINRDYNNHYYSFELPDINENQYIEESDLIVATKSAESILRQNKDVQRLERDCKNKNALDF